MTRPILFSAPMMRALLAGTKTQTRRVVVFKNGHTPTEYPKGAVWGVNDGRSCARFEDGTVTAGTACPYGAPGDVLWTREAWRAPAGIDDQNAAGIADKAAAAGYSSAWAPVLYIADGERRNWDDDIWGKPGRYRHARFMPRWASRLTLELTDVRVERVQGISVDDAWAEGMDRASIVYPTDQYADTWTAINGEDSWRANPWVWGADLQTH